ncbi:serine hydrolase domain-containing protein [Massilia scottii]|uniref:serine hydrolase domain-containing protein n=1 Tax=Massilia scottii TaxID=3057166 RepID=UPI002796AAE1|nr:serine hydrolase domain-containing protein [Massilia sp. CCM 9029]MDQ1832105.1 serine hydrolase domain-containing protein [Massilia sp. CCM 9029]
MLFRQIAVIAALTLASAARAAAPDKLDAIVKSAMAGSKVPAVGAVILRDGAVSAQTVQGRQRSDQPRRAGTDDVWLIGSTGKVMTVAMIARLAERGVLAWNVPLEKTLPDLAAGMLPDYRQLTLLQLLSHRAGLPRDLINLKGAEHFFTDTRPTAQQRLAYIAEALRDKPELAPGTAFAYSNTGFLIAAAIAEKATGETYEALMRKEVFAPLAMRHAGFGNTGNGQNRGHQHGKPMLDMVKFDDGAPAMFAPAGFLHMSLADWARFNLDQLAGAKGQGKLLTPASSKLMQTAQPDSPAGLDWGVQAAIAGRQGPALVHQGSDGNWLAIAVLFPEQGSGALVVANAAEDMGADKVLNGIFGKLFPTLSPAK